MINMKKATMRMQMGTNISFHVNILLSPGAIIRWKKDDSR